MVWVFLLLGVIFLGASFYARFPEDLCRRIVTYTISTRYSIPQVSVGSCRPVFPLGVRLTHLVFPLPLAMSGAEVEVQELVLKPMISFAWGRPAFRWFASFLGGRLDGIARGTGQMTGEVRFDGLNLDNQVLRSIFRREVRGKVKGKLILQGNGLAQMSFSLNHGFYQLFLPGFSGLEINDAEGKVSFEKSLLLIEKVEVLNPSLRGRLKGVITPCWQALENSRLDLTWELESPHTGKTVNVIQGTIDTPFLTTRP